ncbi:MAG TPA: GNAT family N-acetyltransferase [Kineosporiaceae bacterium]
MTDVPRRTEVLSVRRLGPAEWAVLRALRLAALGDAPSAFLADLAVEARRPPTEWISRCLASDWLVVTVDDRDAGLVSLARRPGDEVAHVEGMWVTPQARGRGAARLLLRTVEVLAGQRGETTVGLWVFDCNPAARSFYERFGYRAVRPVPRRQRLRDVPGHERDGRIEEELRKPLWAGCAVP